MTKEEKTCLIERCGEPRACRGLCKKHANTFYGRKRSMNGDEWKYFEAEAILAGLILPSRNTRDPFKVAMPNKRDTQVVEVMFVDGELSGETRFVERSMLEAGRFLSFSKEDAFILWDGDTAQPDLRYRPVLNDGLLAFTFSRFLLTFED